MTPFWGEIKLLESIKYKKPTFMEGAKRKPVYAKPKAVYWVYLPSAALCHHLCCLLWLNARRPRPVGEPI